ncbi:MAG: competence protein CoiA family protein [Candidatus Eremiobacterota bacterium]
MLLLQEAKKITIQQEEFLFKIPLALDEKGNEIYPNKAQKGVKYFCPDCLGELVFRAGPIRIHHFAHKVDPEYCDFIHNYESEEHLKAKQYIVKVIEENKKIELIRECVECKEVFYQQLPTENLKASLEYKINGFRADVALLNKDNNVKAIIEVMATHAVDHKKKKALNNINWGEILAENILNENTNKWKVIYDNFKTPLCTKCKDIKKFLDDYNFSGKFNNVLCPKFKREANVINDCLECECFIDITKHKICCIGRKYA